jgi:tetratricopeptide (TPR) repeat protein
MSVEAIRRLSEKGELGKAWALLKPHLIDKPDDYSQLMLATYILDRQGEWGAGYQIAKRVCDLAPHNASTWLNMGKMADNLWRMDEAIECYEKALVWAPGPAEKALCWINISAAHMQMGRFRKAGEAAERALQFDGESRKARHNLGLSQLAARNWSEGWRNYRYSMGSDARPQFNYGEQCKEWRGEPGRVLVVTGEQGLGDEICAASMYTDAIAKSERVILDTVPRLVGLFARSFPQAKVYATRGDKVLDWDAEDAAPDASITGMQLGEYFRTAGDAFPSGAYLKPCPIRTQGWRTHFDSLQRPVIGVAWTGGILQTGAKWRRWTLEDLLPLFRSMPEAHFICLEWKDAHDEIARFHVKHPDVDLVQYPWATLTDDYDDTAALVAALDCVVSMQTSVIHLAGALGVPTHVGVCKVSQWRYGESGDSMPWYGSVRLHRHRKDDSWPMADIARAASADVY